MTAQKPSAIQRLWILYTRLAARIFYRRLEVSGAENLPADKAAMVCANHANSIADVALLQKCFDRILHPLARSGLFKKPFLRIVLWVIQAVPIYRAHDPGSDTAQNSGSFDRCYEMLNAGEVLVIFPEGVSHSEPALQRIKTGAARIALGSLVQGGPCPVLIPAGLSFLKKGTFRSRALILIGEPVPIDDLAREALAAGPDENGEASRDVTRKVTERLEKAIRELTINHDNWEDLALIRQLERFFHFREGRKPGETPLAERFHTFKRLLKTYRQLKDEAPEQVYALRRKLVWFERVRKLYGIEDFHLHRHYTAGWMALYLLYALVFAIVALPLGLWGALTSGIPYFLVRLLTPVVAKGPDQYDTTKILLGGNFVGSFWAFQIFMVFQRYGSRAALLFGLSLPVGAAVAMLLIRRRRRLEGNLRAFLLFWRRGGLRRYLLKRRQEIQVDLDELAKLARD